MSRKSCKRVVRPLRTDVVHLALMVAARLTGEEVRQVFAPLQASTDAMRRGVGTENDWSNLAAACCVAKAIERQGVVRGLQEHFDTIEAALQGIARRAFAGGAWAPTPLYFQELDALQLFLDLHEFQVRQLSGGEFQRAVVLATAHVRDQSKAAVPAGQQGHQAPTQLELVA